MKTSTSEKDKMREESKKHAYRTNSLSVFQE